LRQNVAGGCWLMLRIHKFLQFMLKNIFIALFLFLNNKCTDSGIETQTHMVTLSPYLRTWEVEARGL
jgi:hypothetical protein